MAIVASDLVKRLSVTAATGDSTPGTAGASLGGKVSTTVITDNAAGNILPDISAAEATAGNTDYGCFFVLNNHATLTATNTSVSVLSQIASGATFTIALDNAAISAKGSGGTQATTIATKNTAPSGVGAFGAGPLTIGDIPPGQVKAVWIKRDVTAGAGALNPDGGDIRISCETLP